MCKQIRRHNGFVSTPSVVPLHRVLAEIADQSKRDGRDTVDGELNAAYSNAD